MDLVRGIIKMGTTGYSVVEKSKGLPPLCEQGRCRIVACVRRENSARICRMGQVSGRRVSRVVDLYIRRRPTCYITTYPFGVSAGRVLCCTTGKGFGGTLTVCRGVAPFPVVLYSKYATPYRSGYGLYRLNSNISVQRMRHTVIQCKRPKEEDDMFHVEGGGGTTVFNSKLFPLFLTKRLRGGVCPAAVCYGRRSCRDCVTTTAKRLLRSSHDGRTGHLGSVSLSFRFKYDLGLSFVERGVRLTSIMYTSRRITGVLTPRRTTSIRVVLERRTGVIDKPTRSIVSTTFTTGQTTLAISLLMRGLSPRDGENDRKTIAAGLCAGVRKVRKSGGVFYNRSKCSGRRTMRRTGQYVRYRYSRYVGNYICLDRCRGRPNLLTHRVCGGARVVVKSRPVGGPVGTYTLYKRYAIVYPGKFSVDRIYGSTERGVMSASGVPLTPRRFTLVSVLFSGSRTFLDELRPKCRAYECMFFPNYRTNTVTPSIIVRTCRSLDGQMTKNITLVLKYYNTVDR